MALIATSLFISLALADDSQLTFINTTSDDLFQDFIKAANASTVQEIELPNIHTNEYPSNNDNNTTWKAWLRIDEERARGGIMYAGLHPDEEYISDNSTVQSDDSWLTCMKLTRFRNPSLSLDESIESDCSNVFSDECLEFLDLISKDGRLCLNATTHRGQWEDSPCSGALNSEHTRNVLEPEKSFRVTHLRNLTTAAVALNEDGDPDNRYNALVNSVYMLSVGFARASDWQNSLSRPTIDQDAETVQSRFICMRADDFSDGSRTLDDIEDVGLKASAPISWMMMLAAFVVAMTASVMW